MKLTARSVSNLLAAFRSSEPTPGGGSAAALAGAVGASLLAMVAALSKPTAASDADRQRLAGAGTRCSENAIQLEALIDQDSDAYDLVVAAFRLPKATDEDRANRATAIQRALVTATEAPLEVMRRAADALETAPVIAALGNPNASSDVEVALALLGASLRGAQQNVEINLGSLKDVDYVTRVKEESARLATAGTRAPEPPVR
ncbi:MAG: cyclodeaminase/cyclohydrolase family protein [Acidobacteria bacterium]|nr:cyclodeaminase/cyclohydrolase family protein [Acidobacteriota bacterium]